MSTVRRVYFYAVCLVTLVLAAWGAGLLLRLLFDLAIGGRPTFAGPGYANQQIALGLSMFTIPAAVWAFHWRTVQRLGGAGTQEAASALRKLYLAVTLAASSLTALMTGVTVLRWLLGGADSQTFSAGAAGAFPVALGVWYYNWRVNSRDGAPSPAGGTLLRWYWYFVAAWSLVLLATGIINTLRIALDHGIFISQPLVQGPLWSEPLQMRVAAVLLGLAWWSFHWLYAARDDSSSSLRQVYCYLFAIPGGALAAIVSLAIVLFRLLEFLLGVPVGSEPGFFRFLSLTAPTLLVGAAVWTYHWQRTKEEASGAAERRSSARRVYYYLLSGIGLAATSAGVITLIGLLLDFLLNSLNPAPLLVISPGWWKDQLALTVVLLALGLAAWLLHWLRTQREIDRSEEERFARSRKVYLYTFLCISIIASVAAAINIAYRLLSGFLQGTVAFDILNSMKWSLQLLCAAIPALVYHAGLLRYDIRVGAERTRTVKTIVVVASKTEAGSLAQRLERALGMPVRAMAYDGPGATEDGKISEQQVEVLAQAIAASPHSRLVVLLQGTEIKAYSYEEASRHE